MKKIISAILLLSILAGNAKAGNEERTNNMALSYGYFTTGQMAYVLGAALGSAFSLGNASYDNMKFSGSIGLEYYHSLGKHWELGAMVTAEHFQADVMQKDSSTDSFVKSREMQANIFTIGPAARIRWVIKPSWNFYSKASVGMFLNTNNDDKSLGFSFQAVPVGFEGGGESVRAFAELGIGMSGLIAGGIRFRF